MNQNTIRIINEGAKELEAIVIAMFQINDSGDKYSIYTFNEEDAQGLVKIYASRMVEVAGLYSFVSVSNADEWNKVKDVMKYMAKTDDNDGTNGGKIKLIPVGEIKKQMKEPISVNLSETKAAKIGPNYKSGIINCYNKNAKSPVSQTQQSVQETPQLKNEEKAVEVNIPDMSIPSFEIPKQDSTKIEMPKMEPVVTPINTVVAPDPIPDMPKVDVVEPKVEEPKIKEPSVSMDIPVPDFKIPKIEANDVNEEAKPEPIDSVKEEIKKEEKVEDKKSDYSFEPPKFNDDEEDTGYDTTPNVDSILNKASYYQNVKEEETKPASDNIIQNIGLEFMKKVSELAEYEKELNRKNRDLEARERILTKLEKEISSKEEKQKNLNQANKKKEIELKRYEKELDDRDSDLNRRIIEFNKKISMFQQTFETISKVD